MTEPRGDQRPPSPRGSTPQPPRFRVGRGWLIFFVGLLILNFVLTTRATERERVSAM